MILALLQIADYWNLACEPNLDWYCHRQENPDLQEPPESAPLGIVAAPLAGTLMAEKTLFNSELPQTLQVTPEISEETRNLSKYLPQSLQENL